MPRAIFFLTTAGYEPAWQAASMVLTAVAMGDEVVIVPSFDALRALARGTFGKALNDKEKASLKRGEKLGAPEAARMLQEARSLGARVIACDTTVKLCGLDAAELEGSGTVDEVTGLPSIWRLTQDSRVLTF